MDIVWKRSWFWVLTPFAANIMMQGLLVSTYFTETRVPESPWAEDCRTLGCVSAVCLGTRLMRL
eukprot:1555059-Rhodomonas_salina.2